VPRYRNETRKDMNKGDVFTRQFEVTEALCNGFVDLFRDRNPLHTDEGFAQSKGFRSMVVHGNILNGFLSFFIGECLPRKDVIIHKQDIKFSRPVYRGDVLTLKATLDDVFESVGAHVFKFSFTNAEGREVASGRIQIGVLP
jgi:3-hydroxybutyryl-CoA dehydratase